MTVDCQPFSTKHASGAPAQLPTKQLVINSGEDRLWVSSIWDAKAKEVRLSILIVVDKIDPGGLARSLIVVEEIRSALASHGAVGNANYWTPSWIGRKRLTEQDVQRLLR